MAWVRVCVLDFWFRWWATGKPIGHSSAYTHHLLLFHELKLNRYNKSWRRFRIEIELSLRISLYRRCQVTLCHQQDLHCSIHHVNSSTTHLNQTLAWWLARCSYILASIINRLWKAQVQQNLLDFVNIACPASGLSFRTWDQDQNPGRSHWCLEAPTAWCAMWDTRQSPCTWGVMQHYWMLCMMNSTTACHVLECAEALVKKHNTKCQPVIVLPKSCQWCHSDLKIQTACTAATPVSFLDISANARFDSFWMHTLSSLMIHKSATATLTTL